MQSLNGKQADGLSSVLGPDITQLSTSTFSVTRFTCPACFVRMIGHNRLALKSGRTELTYRAEFWCKTESETHFP
jgi:hypothetical protein